MSALRAATDLIRYRELALELAKVQVRARYRNAVLGAGWTLATPLALALVFTGLFKPIYDIPVDYYGIWLLSALFPWTFLSASVGETIRALGANATFIKAYRFPREVLPVSGVLAQLLNFGVALAIVLIASLIQYGPRWPLLWLPAVVALTALFTTGLCLLLAGLDAVYKDVRYLVDLALMGWFFLTPIFYTLDMVASRTAQGTLHPALGWAIQLNPATALVEAFRASLVPGRPMPSLWYPTAVALLLLWFGLGQFRRLVDKYVDLL